MQVGEAVVGTGCGGGEGGLVFSFAVCEAVKERRRGLVGVTSSGFLTEKKETTHPPGRFLLR